MQASDFQFVSVIIAALVFGDLFIKLASLHAAKVFSLLFPFGCLSLMSVPLELSPMLLFSLKVFLFVNGFEACLLHRCGF